jgi:hypothetical protein
MTSAFSVSRWRNAVLISAAALLVWVFVLRHCLVLLPLNKAIFIALLPPFLLFGLLMLQWRAGLLIAAGALVCGYFFLPPHLNPMPISASESSAVQVLFAMARSPQARMQNASNANARRGRFPVERFYRFEYHQSDRGFDVTATLLPTARSCGCVRNFILTSEGVLHYSSESRQATRNDLVVDVPTSLLNSFSN